MVYWSWKNETKCLIFSSWADAYIFSDTEPSTDSSDFTLQLNDMGVSVFKDILFDLTSDDDKTI